MAEKILENEILNDDQLNEVAGGEDEGWADGFTDEMEQMGELIKLGWKGLFG